MIKILLNILKVSGSTMKESNVKQMRIVQPHIMASITKWKIGMSTRTMPKKIDQHICITQVIMDIGI